MWVYIASGQDSAPRLAYGGIRKSLVGINQVIWGRYVILESLVLPTTALLILQREVSPVVRQEEPASSFLKLGSYSTNSFNQTRQHFHIIFLSHHLP
jgi:hypothetical protein